MRNTAKQRGGKSLPEEQRAAARDFIQHVVDSHFNGVATKAAAKFGISQGYLSEFLGGGRGPGNKLLDGVARHLGISQDLVTGRRVYAQSSTITSTPMLGSKPEFGAVLADARLAHPLVSEAIWMQIARSVIHGYKLTPDFLYELARMIEPVEPLADQ
jgi:hypothetical protein